MVCVNKFLFVLQHTCIFFENKWLFYHDVYGEKIVNVNKNILKLS